MRTGFKVCDAMTHKPIYISSLTSLQDCAKIMAEKHLGSLLIKDDQDLMGIITEQDIVRKSVIANHDHSKKTAGEIMETDLHLISPEKDVFEALSEMKKHNIRQLPVISNNEMIGLVTLKDILKIQPQLFELMLDRIELREEERKLSYKDVKICPNCNSYCNSLFEKNGEKVCQECFDE